ncbi:MAG: hypothetical protein KUG77_09850 [Nannocystaceae bacterium]|nr:hypothetical protein [Nannocystaceae bacterium]
MLRSILVTSFGLSLMLGGCVSAVDFEGDTDEESSSGAGSSSSGGNTMTTAPGVTTNATATSGGVTTTPATTDDSADESTTGDDGGFISPDTGNDTSTEPQPNGAQCAAAPDCESAFCYVIPQVGGVCSECLVDEDCDTGTCSLDAVGYAICTDGSQGNMCNTDEGCAGELVCTELIDTGGIINANFCSQCGPSAPCVDDQICAPVYDLGNLGGYFACSDPGTVEDGQGCPLTDGDAACDSGHCGLANLFGFAELGVCGECNANEDCPEAGQTCVDPEAGMDGLTPAFCM